MFLWPLLAIAFTIQEPSTPADAPARITLRRTPCFGECPDYTVTIDRDGTVTYEGRRFVRVTGRQTARITPAAVTALLDEFQQIDFFSLKDRYNAPVTDLPTTYVTLRLGERSKTVEDYVGAPKPLRDLERHIDEAAGVQRWIRIDTATGKDLVRSGSNVEGPNASGAPAVVMSIFKEPDRALSKDARAGARARHNHQITQSRNHQIRRAVFFFSSLVERRSA